MSTQIFCCWEMGIRDGIINSAILATDYDPTIKHNRLRECDALTGWTLGPCNSMYRSGGTHAQIFQQTSTEQHKNQFGEALYGAGSDLIKGELSAYGEKLLGSGSAFVHSNIFLQPAILFSSERSGHWMRATKTVKGKFCYKPPIDDINALDLYIPLMAFGTSVVLAGFFLGINGKFSPEALGVQFTNGLLCWLFQVLLMKATLHALGDGEIPLLDVVAYSGYTFVAVSIALLAKVVTCSYCYYVVSVWESFCMGMLFVKILKRIVTAEVRICEKHSSKRHYLLLLVAIAELPLLFWLGNVGV